MNALLDLLNQAEQKLIESLYLLSNVLSSTEDVEIPLSSSVAGDSGRDQMVISHKPSDSSLKRGLTDVFSLDIEEEEETNTEDEGIVFESVDVTHDTESVISISLSPPTLPFMSHSKVEWLQKYMENISFVEWVLKENFAACVHRQDIPYISDISRLETQVHLLKSLALFLNQLKRA